MISPIDIYEILAFNRDYDFAGIKRLNVANNANPFMKSGIEITARYSDNTIKIAYVYSPIELQELVDEINEKVVSLI